MRFGMPGRTMRGNDEEVSMTTTPDDSTPEFTHHATAPAEGRDDDRYDDDDTEVRVHTEEPAEGREDTD